MKNDQVDPIAIQKPLLAWYAGHKRDLPWRKNPSPYTVWVSEIMAQQTRINQLLPYYKRFVTQFPTVKALADAPLDAVMKAWAGMGYYSRARHLHETAQIIANERAGVWPETATEWRSLPGVGAYTAGAVMSIAFGVPEAAVDGNVLRVYARLACDSSDTGAAKGAADRLIRAAMPEEPDEIRNFSQALMELGALVCVPDQPLCGECPLSSLCGARLTGSETRFPVKTPKKPPVMLRVTVLLIINPEGNILMRKRTERLLQDLWVFYLMEKEMTLAEACKQVGEMGYTVVSAEPVGEASHVFTHRKWLMTGYALYVSETHTVGDYVFMSQDQAREAAQPKATAFYSEWYSRLS